MIREFELRAMRKIGKVVKVKIMSLFLCLV